MDADFEFFLAKILIQATARIEPHYFQLPVADGEDPVYRERVYCYELYHRMRECMPTDYAYVLNGEVDKSGHPLIRNEVGPVKPDFVVHVPRAMDRNLAVIEVKSIKAPASSVHKDLEVLRAFLDRVQYHRAIHLVYGNGTQQDYAIFRNARQSTDDRDGRILFIWHRQPMTRAVVVTDGAMS